MYLRPHKGRSDCTTRATGDSSWKNIQDAQQRGGDAKVTAVMQSLGRAYVRDKPCSGAPNRHTRDQGKENCSKTAAFQTTTGRDFLMVMPSSGRMGCP